MLALGTYPQLGGLNHHTGVEIQIGSGETYVHYQTRSLRIRSLLDGVGTAAFRIVDLENDSAVEEGCPVSIWAAGALVFRGLTYQVREEWKSDDDNVVTGHYSVTARDWNSLPTRKLVAASFEVETQTAGDIVQTLITDYLAGFGVTAGMVSAGPVIPSILWNQARCADALSELATLSGFSWWIDHDRRLNFCPRDAASAPYTMTDARRNYATLKCLKSGVGYSNRRLLRAGRDIGAARSEDFEGDDETTNFPLAHPPGKEPTFKINGGAAQTVGIRGLDDDGDPSGYQWFWNKDDQIVSQNTEHTPLGDSDVLEVTYRPLLRIIVEARDDREVADRADKEALGTDGTVESIEEDAQIESAELALESAQARLRDLAQVGCEFDITTPIQGLRQGQLLTLDLARERAHGDFLITSLTVSDRGGEYFLYRVKALESAEKGGWRAFYRMILRSTRSLVQRENEIVLTVWSNREDVKADEVLTTDESDTLPDWEDDDWNVCILGDSWVGRRWVDHEGNNKHVGPHVGEVTHP